MVRQPNTCYTQKRRKGKETYQHKYNSPEKSDDRSSLSPFNALIVTYSYHVNRKENKSDSKKWNSFYRYVKCGIAADR